VCNLSLLTFALRKKLGKLEMSELRATFLPLGVGVVLAGVTAFGCWQLWERGLGHHNLALKIGAVFAPAIVAGVIYWAVGILGKVPAAQEILNFVFAKFLKKSNR
jgi:hypothetical protein